MSNTPQVQQQSNMVAAASASLCLKTGTLKGIILSTRELISDDDEIDVINGEIMFVGFKSIQKQFETDDMVRFVHVDHPKFDKILAAAKAKGIIKNEQK